MKISQLLKEEMIEPNLTITEKDAVLEHLVRFASPQIKEKSSVDIETVLQALRDREATMSTGIGNGVAIPHAKVEGLNQIIVVFARSLTGVNFQALDDAPVNLIFLIIAPPAATNYLKLLATISALLKKKKSRTALMQAKDQAEIMAVIKAEE
jgi:PTS system nitrogen regulatory IIA component